MLWGGAGAEWPLSRKFGCVPELAPRVLEHAHPLGLIAFGLSFHVGSQQPNPRMWDGALKAAAATFHDLAERGIALQMVNLGGGFPAKYVKNVPAVRPTRRRSCIHCAAISATIFPKRSSSPAAAWSATPG